MVKFLMKINFTNKEEVKWKNMIINMGQNKYKY